MNFEMNRKSTNLIVSRIDVNSLKNHFILVPDNLSNENPNWINRNITLINIQLSLRMFGKTFHCSKYPIRLIFMIFIIKLSHKQEIFCVNSSVNSIRNLSSDYTRLLQKNKDFTTSTDGKFRYL